MYVLCDWCGTKIHGLPEFVSELGWGDVNGVASDASLFFCRRECQWCFCVDLHRLIMPGSSREKVLAHVAEELGFSCEGCSCAVTGSRVGGRR